MKLDLFQFLSSLSSFLIVIKLFFFLNRYILMYSSHILHQHSKPSARLVFVNDYIQRYDRSYEK